MRKKIKSTKSVLVLSAVTYLIFSNSVFAHEPRAIAGGGLNVVVGWKVEPAFSKTLNAFDFIVTDQIDVADPEITVKALYLKEDHPDAKVLMSEELEGDLRRDRGNPNRFNIWFLPNKAGAYGFHIKGMVNGMMVDEVFICGGGSQHIEGRAFSCMESPQKFPGGKKSNHDDDD